MLRCPMSMMFSVVLRWFLRALLSALDPLDQEIERDPDDGNDEGRDAQPPPAEIILVDRLPPVARDDCGRNEPFLHHAPEPLLVDRMDHRARLQPRLAGLAELELRFRDFHPPLLGLIDEKCGILLRRLRPQRALSPPRPGTSARRPNGPSCAIAAAPGGPRGA